MYLKLMLAVSLTCILTSCANMANVSGNLPRAYSSNDSDLVTHKQYSNWSTYCQNSNGNPIGCAAHQKELTVYITIDGRPQVIIGGNDYHKPGTTTCITLDGVESCLDNTEANISSYWSSALKLAIVARKGRWFMDKIFWGLENASTVSIKYTPLEGKTNREENINMSEYKQALAEIRRQLK